MSAKKLTTSQFIERANLIHANKYLYTNEYTGSRDFISVQCPVHGKYSVRAYSHLSGTGCKQCDVERRAAQYTLTHQQFVDQARAVHGDRYKYHDTYQHSQMRITIECPTHGEFVQLPTSHLRGSGCQKCRYPRTCHPQTKMSGGSGMYSSTYFKANPTAKDLPAYLYVINIIINDIKLIKVGITKNISSRLQNYNKHSGSLIYCLPLPLYEAFLLERSVTKALHQHRYAHTPHFVGHTECFCDNVHVGQYLNQVKEAYTMIS